MIELMMKIFDRKIRITAENQSAIEDICNTFSYFMLDECTEPIDINILVEDSSSDDFRIIYDEKISACAKVNLYPKLCDIIRRSIICKTNLFCFHAAAVEKNGKAYVFISTGNSGKSTLCTALIFNGYKLLTDDTCWIDPSNGIIYPYPLAIGTRHKTLDLLPALREIAIETTFPGKLILPVENDWVAPTCKVFAYFIWELDFNTPYFDINAVETDELTYNLLSHSFSFKYCLNKKDLFNKLLHTVSHCECFSLKGHNLSVLPQLLDNLS